MVVGHYFVIAMYEKLLALDYTENKFIFIIPINTHLIIPHILKKMWLASEILTNRPIEKDFKTIGQIVLTITI